MAFWITSRMKTKREQMDEEMMVIKLFASNYARDLYITPRHTTTIVFIELLTDFIYSKINLRIRFYHYIHIYLSLLSLPAVSRVIRGKLFSSLFSDKVMEWILLMIC